MTISETPACLAAAEAGLGIAFSPDFVAGDSLRAGRVQGLLQDFDPGPLGVLAMYPSARHLAAKVRVLVDFLVRRLGEERQQVLPFADMLETLRDEALAPDLKRGN